MSLMYGDDGGEPPIHYEYEGFYPGSNLALIRDRDPDGWEREPTEADYAAHREWAIREFGEETWHSYTGGRELDDREPGE
jgi:hypothetical protein